MDLRKLEAPPGFEPGMEVLQTSALPLGDGADCQPQEGLAGRVSDGMNICAVAASRASARQPSPGSPGRSSRQRAKAGAGNGIRTRDFDLGKVALYH